MGQHSTCRSAVLLMSIVLASSLALGSAQLETEDLLSASTGYSRRLLEAYYSRNFGNTPPQKCYRSSYFSPYRLYFMEQYFDGEQTFFKFQLDVTACPVTGAYCCNQLLDHMVLRTAAAAKITEARLDGVKLAISQSSKGLTLFDTDITPDRAGASIKNHTLILMADAEDYELPKAEDNLAKLCPGGRVAGNCDVVMYNQDELCCTERSALNRALFYPASGDTEQQDGWNYCCIDDIVKSPFILKYNGMNRTGSDTFFLFQVIVRKVNSTAIDFDGPEEGDCSMMNFRDMGIAIYDNLLVKYVSFNGSIYNHYTMPSGAHPDAKMVYMDVFRQYSDFDEEYPIDVAVVVRGKVDTLCPATEYMYSPSACEYAFHGKHEKQHCCPHGITKKQGPPEECCVDDLEKAPYRMDYVSMAPTKQNTTLEFTLSLLKDVSGTDFDLWEPAICDKMSLDYAQIQLYKHVEVLEVRWDERVMPFNLTDNTGYSNWLNINSINRLITDFDPSVPVKFSVVVSGFVREPCPGTMIFESSAAPVCQYVLHGQHSQYTCCPHGFTGRGEEVEECGCRDDLAETPYRLGYTLAQTSEQESCFNFNLALVDPAASRDYDLQFPEYPSLNDATRGFEVNCSSMDIKDMVFAIGKDVEVVDVMFNGFNYTWQYESYVPGAKWLRVLDLDYKTSDLSAEDATKLTLVVKGGAQEICPAAGRFGSQASCEYFILGHGELHAECCPRSVTSWYNPAMWPKMGASVATRR